ncbi:MAG TPA: ABC transporter permease [Thermoanaerobaculia bacterium]|nr:ABC transporter permease [Thermoanaerobaculia bacterium]
MNPKPLAVAFCGLLALAVTACEELRKWAGDKKEDQEPWLQNVLAAEVRLPEKGQAAAAQLSQLLERAESMPGVERVAVIDVLPGAIALWHRVPIERESSPPDMRPAGYVEIVSPRYFETMGLILLQGRFFGKRDDDSSPPVAIVNESYARRMRPPDEGRSILGERVRVGGSSGLWMTIVGVVRDGPRVRNVPEVYVPYTQQVLYGSGSRYPAGAHPWYMLARVKSDREVVAAGLQQVLGWEFRTMEERLKAYTKGPPGAGD